MAERDVEIKLNALPLNEDDTLMLAIGICYGVVVGKDDIDQVRQAGAAKVLEMV